MEPTQNPGKRVQASYDWCWFYFLLDNKEVTPGNPENENGISFYMHSSENRHTMQKW